MTNQTAEKELASTFNVISKYDFAIVLYLIVKHLSIIQRSLQNLFQTMCKRENKW